MDQGAAQRGALQHAAGELPGPLVGKTLEPDLGQQGVGAIGELAFFLARVILPKGLDDLERDHDVLADAQPGQHGGVLKGQAQPYAGGKRITLAGCTNLAPAHHHRAGARAQQTGHQLEDGGLAAAAGPDQGHKIALGYAQVGALQCHRSVGVLQAHARQLNQRLAHGWLSWALALTMARL